MIIGVARQSEESQVNQFIDRFSIPYPIGRDTTGEIGDRYGIFSIPTSFLFSPEGKLKRKIQGFGSGVEAATKRHENLLTASTSCMPLGEILRVRFRPAIRYLLSLPVFCSAPMAG
jgi:hypothetical protein